MNRISLCCFASLLAAPVLASDPLSLAGATGALMVPSGLVVASGAAEFQANTSQLRSATREFVEARTYALAIGLLPRVELTGQLAEADRETGGGYNDISANIKVSLFQNQHIALAAGAIDFAGDAQRSAAKYGVATFTYREFALSGGYGQGKALDGPFGSLVVKPMRHVELLADYDSEHYSVGTRLSYQFQSSTTLTGTAKLYSNGPQKNAFGLGISRNLDFRKDRDGKLSGRTETGSIFDALGSGLANVSLTKGSEGSSTLRAENRAFHQRQADSDTAACNAAGTAAKSVAYRQLRHGLPILTTQLDCAGTRTGPSSWWTMVDDASEIRRDFGRLDAYSLEIKIAPDLRSFVGTEVGIIDASVALFSSARLQLPAGLGAYVTYESPLQSTDDFRKAQDFDFYRHRNGIREAQVQWAHHLLPGLFGLHSYGKSRQFAIDYRSQRHDLTWNIGSGQHQIYGSQARFKPEDNSFLPTRKVQYAGYRLWLTSLATSIEADYGKFFYGDTGFRAKASRHFGDIIVSLYLKHADADNQVAGLQLSFPLTPRKGISAGNLSIVGSPRFDFDRGTSFGQSNGRNELKPLLMVEPLPSYQLKNDWLDVDRLFPAYPSADR